MKNSPVYITVLTLLLLFSGVTMSQASPRIESNIAHSFLENWANAIIKTDPVQTDIREGSRMTHMKGYRLSHQKNFEIMALVLSAKKYPRMAGDHTTALAPVDLALGWGPMSDTNVLREINVGQKGRWYYFYWTRHAQIKRDPIFRHSGNMHMIPKNKDIAEKLKSLERGNIVKITGKLTNAYAPGGWSWISSQSRSDTGDGSCEVIYVEDIKISHVKAEWEQSPKKHKALR